MGETLGSIANVTTRNMIRKVSPLNDLPYEYRHLVEMRFVLGHHLLPNGEVDMVVEEGLRIEQEERGDILQLHHLKHGNCLREGKFLYWLQATEQPGERDAWWTMKIDDDVSVDSAVGEADAC